jgi:hypothetical protein
VGERDRDRDHPGCLDGNAAAGLLSELFCVEMTTAVVACAGCGAAGPVAELALYGHEMGQILRCQSCETAVIRVARTGGRLWLDLRGAAVLRVDGPRRGT